MLAWRLGLQRHDPLPGVLGGMVWSLEQQLVVLRRIGSHLLGGDLWLAGVVFIASRRRAHLALPVLAYLTLMSVVMAGSPAGLAWLSEAERSRLLMALVPLTLCTAGAGALWDYRQSRGSGSSSKQAVSQP